MAAIILFCGIGEAIIGPMLHGMTWMTIRSAMITGEISSLSPMEAIVEQGGILLNVWIIGVVLLLVISILIVWSSAACHTVVACISKPDRPQLAYWHAGFIFRDRPVLPMAPNLAHLGFFIALYWCLHSGRVQQPA